MHNSQLDQETDDMMETSQVNDHLQDVSSTSIHITCGNATALYTGVRCIDCSWYNVMSERSELIPSIYVHVYTDL